MIFRRYRVANLIYNLNTSSDFFIPDHTSFEYNCSENCDMPIVRIKNVSDPLVKGYKQDSRTPFIDGEKTPIGIRVFLFDIMGFVAHQIDAKNNWSEISIVSSMPQKLPFLGSVGEVIFRTAILFHMGIVVHASAITYKGKGIVFSAPSGTGKSTHANLWAKHRCAEILNGDRPALRVNGDEVLVYGTPWSGTSNQYLNKSAPLTAIFLLEQSPVNEIQKISQQEALQRFMARCYLPYFDRDLMGLALDNIGAVMERVPVYLLKCTPDLEAVEKVMSFLDL